MKFTPPDGIGLWKEKTPSGFRWVVNVGKKFLGRSKPPYKNTFQTRADAEKAIKTLVKKQSDDFAGAEELGISKIQMAEVRVALKKIGNTSLLDVVDFWEKSEKPFLDSPTIKQAIADLVELKKVEGKGERHLEELEDKLLDIFKNHLDYRIDQITHAIMVKLVAVKDGNGSPPSSPQKAKRIRYARILFNAARRQGKIARSPLDAFAKLKKVPSPVFVLPPKSVANLLWHCQQLNEKLLPSILLKCFSGVRNSELFQITWDMVGDEIIVPAAFSKTERRRVITIHPTLKAWLKGRKGVDGTLVCPLPPPRKGQKDSYKRKPNIWYKKIRPIARAAGITPWPQNALRHLFGSYHMSLHSNEGLTAYEMGNSITTVKQNYINAVKKDACKKFWELLPAKVEALADKSPANGPEGLIDTDEGDPDEGTSIESAHTA